MIKKLARRDDCGECSKKFQLFETVYYLDIDSDTYCSDCRRKINLGKPDDWVPSLYVGTSEEGRENILRLIKLWNESMYEEFQIGVPQILFNTMKKC